MINVFFNIVCIISCKIKYPSLQSDGGVMVSIVAFQAVDPGSIPGLRMILFCWARGDGALHGVGGLCWAGGAGICRCACLA